MKPILALLPLLPLLTTSTPLSGPSVPSHLAPRTNPPLPAAGAIFYLLPTCLNPLSSALLQVALDAVTPNTCYDSDAKFGATLLESGFASFYGYSRDGSPPAGYKCDFKAYYAERCEGTLVGSGGGNAVCTNSLVDLGGGKVMRVLAKSFQWECLKV